MLDELMSNVILDDDPLLGPPLRSSRANVLMIGTGEYTTGFVPGATAESDKKAGVVALTMFDLRLRGKVNRLGLCGVNGRKFPDIKNHMKKMIEEVYAGLSTEVETFPRDDETNPSAYLNALATFQPGDAVTIFTPDDTHFDIALAAIERGLHVLVTKPAVQTLEQHKKLIEAAKKHNVLVAIEVHKRWDPMYADARDRIQRLGSFSYIYSYMSQPKYQLHTFSNWAGKGSDISYYLNSHHVDFHEWTMGNKSRPVTVTANASTGIAKASHNMDCEDTITLLVQWENLDEVGVICLFCFC
jgi:D-galacturonate reductase